MVDVAYKVHGGVALDLCGYLIAYQILCHKQVDMLGLLKMRFKC